MDNKLTNIQDKKGEITNRTIFTIHDMLHILKFQVLSLLLMNIVHVYNNMPYVSCVVHFFLNFIAGSCVTKMSPSEVCDL